MSSRKASLRHAAEADVFTSTMGKQHEASTESFGLTLSAARAAAQELTGTMKDKEAKRARAKRRAKKRQQKAIAAAEEAAAAAGVTFTGTMKQQALRQAIDIAAADGEGENYAEDEFEKDDDDDDYAGDTFEADSSPLDIGGGSGAPAKASRSRAKRNGGGKSKRSEPSSPAITSGGMEAITIGGDAGFEATIGGTRRSKPKKRKDKSGDALGETYSRHGLPGPRHGGGSDDDGDGYGGHGAASHFHHGGLRESPSMTDDALPSLPTARTPRTASQGTTNYASDSQLPALGARAKRKGSGM